ncbi:hypothetical protein F2Y95_04905 (plasmid) [Aphanizomenon flos-aquae CCAP 1446/1C]|nr:hypothetical protein [Anabaena sp. CCAP 1446/1C]MBY5306746.1 hypothetical protein [Anabaena sp. CCAP 1446/1C]
MLLLSQKSVLAWNPQLEAEFQQRSKEYLESFPSGKYGSNAYEYEKQSYPRAMIDFLKGNEREAIAFLESEDKLSGLHSHTLGIDFYSAFSLKNQIRKYFGFDLTPAYKSRMRQGMRLATESDPMLRYFPLRKFWEKSTDNCNTLVDCRNTDNLKVMRDVSVYLMAEESGNEFTRQIYKNNIYQKVRSLYQTGKGEWDSESYLGHELTGYLNLYDYAKDPEVKQMGKAALDWMTITGAVKYWRGGFGGPSKRDYGGGNCTWCSSTSQYLGMYFGDSPVKFKSSNPDLVHLLLSSYRPPNAAVAIARKQFTFPLELLNSKPAYLNWREDKPQQFHETLYFGKTYQLGTLAEGTGGDWSGFKLLVDSSVRGVDYFIPSFIGHNSVAQYRNLAVCMGKGKFSFMLPKSALVEHDRGWIFIKLERTNLAIALINAEVGELAPTEKYSDSLTLAIKPTADITGFAIDVGEGNYQSFKTLTVVNSRLKVKGQSAEYTSIMRNRVKLEYTGGTPKIWRNGKLHDFMVHRDVYRADVSNLGKAPIYQAYKSGKLEVIVNGIKSSFSVLDTQK